MNRTYLQPRRPRRRRGVRAEVGQLRDELGRSITMTDQFAEADELRITALEEIVAARWPRRILVRWRLARDLRASVARVQGETFTEKRTEAVGSGWVRPLREQR